jgi:hypothetical protein
VRESTAPPAANRSAIVDMTARTRRVDSRVGPPQA